MKEKATENESSAEVFQKLSNYDIITFDVFDTLITRCVLQPADVFSVVESKAKKMGLIDGHFSRDRREAEQLAHEKYTGVANYRQIYEILGSSFAYTHAQCVVLKALEFQSELVLVTPPVGGQGAGLSITGRREAHHIMQRYVSEQRGHSETSDSVWLSR